MKSLIITFVTLLSIASASMTLATEDKPHNHNPQHNMGLMDKRISLNMTPQMKQHQLSNMREHVKAVRAIVGLIADSKFEDASEVAHSKLGLNPKMQAMCTKIGNDDFKTIGLAFHNSADELGEVLLSKDVNSSLRALHKTMQYCVQCHATFRQ